MSTQAQQIQEIQQLQLLQLQQEEAEQLQQQQQLQIQQLHFRRLQQQQQQQQQQLNLQNQQQQYPQVPDLSLTEAVATTNDLGQVPFGYNPSTLPLFSSNAFDLGSETGLMNGSEMLFNSDLGQGGQVQGQGSEWTSYLSLGSDIESMQMMSDEMDALKWSENSGTAFAFEIPGSSSSSFVQDQSRPVSQDLSQLQDQQQQQQQQQQHDQRSKSQDDQQLMQQQLQRQYLQQQEELQLQQQQQHLQLQLQRQQLQKEQDLEQQQQQAMLQQQRLYQLQQQQQLRLQLELASQTHLPQSPAAGMYSPHQHPSFANQFSNGHSPAQSPLSPGNYAGDDYFSSRQASPGPASSPGGSSKIKSRPRPSVNGARVSQGGIKALFGQGGAKSNRASLELKGPDVPLHLPPQQGLTAAAIIAASGGQSPSGDLTSPKTPPLRKKKAAVKAISAEIPMLNQQSIAEKTTSGVSARPTSLTLPKSGAAAPPLAIPTLAERRAAAAAAGVQRRRSASDSSPQVQPTTLVEQLHPAKSLIPPNLGLDAKTQRLAATSPNGTPSGETASRLPLSSPSILTSPATSPAPIQIGRITPRHSSSLARTEEQQRQLDATMERVDFEDVTVAELKEMLRQRGKHGGGKKADLIKRMQGEIDIIRANRQARQSASVPGLTSTTPAATITNIPPPLASPTHNLYKTLHGLHIGSPPLQHSGPPTSLAQSNLRYSSSNMIADVSPGAPALASWKEV
ncbi:hypothetical protein BGZ83_000796 [Gryganskiella cystojenkinii]|nr:hypothetical protein BGZ83_000796 [Gryganskiella cystojenkinii]